MRIMVDNTGVHSVARCLEKRATGELDVRGLLQFATQLVFAEEIAVSTFEAYEVRARTHSVLQDLQSIGFGKELNPIDRDAGSFWKSCLDVAEEFAVDFEYEFPEYILDLTSTAPDFANPSNMPEHQLHRLVECDLSDRELEDIAAKAKTYGAAGVVSYAFAKSDELRKAFRASYIERQGWPENMTQQLAVLFRSNLNHHLANQCKAKYSPAVARARFFRRIQTDVVHLLSKAVAEVATKLQGRPLEYPSIGEFFTRNCKGDPRGVIEEAYRVRELASPLRDALSRRLGDKAWEDDKESAFRRRGEGQEIAAQLKAELGLREKPLPNVAIEILRRVGFPPSPKKGADVLMNWIDNRFRRRRVAVLTDMSKTLAFDNEIEREYRRLVKNVTVKN